LLTFESDNVEPYGIKRDEMVKTMCQKSALEVKTFATHTLFDSEMLY
jgi:hypothetical protein